MPVGAEASSISEKPRHFGEACDSRAIARRRSIRISLIGNDLSQARPNGSRFAMHVG
jgi:hypothetical protein